MLVLTRRLGEKIIIGDDIVVTVTRIDGNLVRLGIDAPRNLSVLREEIYKETREALAFVNGEGKDD